MHRYCSPLRIMPCHAFPVQGRKNSVQCVKTRFAETNEKIRFQTTLLRRSLHIVFTAASTTLVALLSKLRAPPSVVDEPIADLKETLVDASRYVIALQSYLCQVDASNSSKMPLLFFTGVWVVHVFVKPSLHDFCRLLGKIASLPGLSVLVLVV